ncbi:hypothetical protein HC891_18770 [Candidatus Gracilibacteria bacterium]|nr:hypothetical protein [Candidatus Gracilibacteria bacterium]
MLRRLFLVVGALAALLATSIAPAVQAQTSADLRFITSSTLQNSRDVKYPSVAAANDTVHIGAAANKSDALYWTKRDSTTTVGAPTQLGDVSGQPDYHTTSIALGTDGTIYYVWSVDPENSETIYLRFKRPNENWSQPREVVRGARFPVNRRGRYRATTRSWSSGASPIAQFATVSPPIAVIAGRAPRIWARTRRSTRRRSIVARMAGWRSLYRRPRRPAADLCVGLERQ